jgi:hypothetical protein
VIIVAAADAATDAIFGRPRASIAHATINSTSGIRFEIQVRPNRLAH